MDPRHRNVDFCDRGVNWIAGDTIPDANYDCECKKESYGQRSKGNLRHIPYRLLSNLFPTQPFASPTGSPLFLASKSRECLDCSPSLFFGPSPSGWLGGYWDRVLLNERLRVYPVMMSRTSDFGHFTCLFAHKNENDKKTHITLIRPDLHFAKHDT